MCDVRVDSVDRNSDSDEREGEGSLKSILLPSPNSTAGKAATIIFFIAVFITFAGIHTSRNFDISGDFLGVLALLKNVASYGSFYGSPDLAWPEGIDGSHYPITNISIFAFVYLLGFITQDPFKIFVITGSALCVASLASFIWLGRKLGVNLFYCIVGSISFAFSHYFFWRFTGHFFLTDYYVLAFGLALALHISGWIRLSATPLGVSIVALLSGCGNAYYTFFNLLMISIAIVGLVPTRGPLLSILRGFGVAVLCALPALSVAEITNPVRFRLSKGLYPTNPSTPCVSWMRIFLT